MSQFGDNIEIEIVRGGFVLSYPESESVPRVREVFSSPRKLYARIKELVEKFSYVAD